MLIDRLILGCARLTGGASTREAEALVGAALDAGIGHVDTAPSYGMGTAEAVVGQVLRRHGGGVQVTAKLGSARMPYATAYSWLRRGKRALGGGRADPWQNAEPPPARMNAPSGHDFSRAAMASSLDVSRDRLGRVDFLLLHDITAAEVSPEVLSGLAGLAAGGDAQSGYASRCQWDADLDRRFGAASVAQCAISPAWFQGARPPPGTNPLFLHSIVKVGAALRVSIPAFGDALDRAAHITGTGDRDAARIAALYVAAASIVSRARLIIASTHRGRLMAVLHAIDRIEQEGKVAEVVAALRRIQRSV